MPNTTTIAAMASSMNDLLRDRSSVTKEASAQSKKFIALPRFGLAIEDFRQHARVQRLAGKLARFVKAFGACTDGTAVDALARLGASRENASGRSFR
jgi:hypothetical protein